MATGDVQKLVRLTDYQTVAAFCCHEQMHEIDLFAWRVKERKTEGEKEREREGKIERERERERVAGIYLNGASCNRNCNHRYFMLMPFPRTSLNEDPSK